MKNSRIAIIASAVTLAIASFYGTKAPKKMVQAPSAYAGAPYNQTIFFLASGFSGLTTVKGSLKTAQFKTIGGAAVKLVTQVNKVKTLYFHP